MIDGPSESSSGGVETPKQTRLVHVVFLGTPLYEEPDEASPVLAYLNKDTVMEVLGEEAEFLCIRIFEGGTGYVRTTSVVAG